MWHYYLLLGVRSLRRNPALTALMVLTLAIGVAASVSTLTILHVMSGDPLPHKSARLFVPVLDPGPLAGYTPGAAPDDLQMSYRDAKNLLDGKQGLRRAALYGAATTIAPARPDLAVFLSHGLVASRDFFAMFETPFRYGQAWSAAEDASGADMVVLNRALAEKLFGDANPVGRRVSMEGVDYQVSGVLDDWRPLPHAHHLIGNDYFGAADEYVLPLASAVRHHIGVNGNMWCTASSKPGYQGILDSECTWIQFWFETASGADRAALQDYLDGYAVEQRRLGRLPRKAPNTLYDLRQWMEELHVVGQDNRLAAWLAFGFLLLCLVNTIGLLLAKFSVRAAEVGIRRALGAARADIFRQFLIEAGVIGLAGGALGLLFAFGALALIATQSEQLAVVAHMDWQMLALTFALSVLAALAAGLLPTWRACQVAPALQLKSQ
ncbi:MAG TPA: ABC transporter permease [Janthinobacterium sp.]|nr:ABC transporter permease [Janthinobacterium sp.]